MADICTGTSDDGKHIYKRCRKLSKRLVHK